MLTSNRRRRCDTQVVELLQLCPTDRICPSEDFVFSFFWHLLHFALGMHGDDRCSMWAGECLQPSLSFCCSIGDAHWPSLLFGACSEMLINHARSQQHKTTTTRQQNVSYYSITRRRHNQAAAAISNEQQSQQSPSKNTIPTTLRSKRRPQTIHQPTPTRCNLPS